MNFIAHLAAERGWKDLQNLPSVLKVDHHLRSSDGYEMRDGIKKVEFKDGRPYAIKVATGNREPFACLHFQGPSKEHMKDFFERAFGSL